MPSPRGIRVRFRPGREVDSDRGLLANDARIRTLRKVLVSYPEVRHIVPDRVSLDPDTDPRLLETVARFLERQHWLVRDVEVE
jgi:hypothetical protein